MQQPPVAPKAAELLVAGTVVRVGPWVSHKGESGVIVLLEDRPVPLVVLRGASNKESLEGLTAVGDRIEAHVRIDMVAGLMFARADAYTNLSLNTIRGSATLSVKAGGEDGRAKLDASKEARK